MAIKTPRASLAPELVNISYGLILGLGDGDAAAADADQENAEDGLYNKDDQSSLAKIDKQI
jgi:hypothetical protein